MEPDNFYVGYSNPAGARSNSTAAAAFGYQSIYNGEQANNAPAKSGGSPAIVWIGFVVFLIIWAVLTRLPQFDKQLDPRNLDVNGYNVFTIILVVGASWGGFKLFANILANSRLGQTSGYQAFSTFVNYV